MGQHAWLPPSEDPASGMMGNEDRQGQILSSTRPHPLGHCSKRSHSPRDKAARQTAGPDARTGARPWEPAVQHAVILTGQAGVCRVTPTCSHANARAVGGQWSSSFRSHFNTCQVTQESARGCAWLCASGVSLPPFDKGASRWSRFRRRPSCSRWRTATQERARVLLDAYLRCS